MIFETHSHYDDEAYNEDRHELLESMKDSNIGYIINVAASLQSVVTTMELAGKYSFVYGALGIHPEDIINLTDEKLKCIEQEAHNEKCVAIGEIGLDYHYPEPGRDIQKKWFEEQLRMAKRVDKPVIIHSREACADTMEILNKPEMADIRGVMHCYSYTVETAKELLKKDYYFGIGGVVTFSNAKKLAEAVEYIPMDHILLETDCPYLAPTPHRGERNSSLYIPLVAEKIAQIKGISSEEVIEITCNNAKKLFGIQ